ncbi:MAG: cobyric acid synthase CobQ, partial [Rhodospirillales bacterium]|nr:cobyric acid synthase CobQ [Rhodospirillales bacterium]
RGGRVLGICAGFQMLGAHIYDLYGLEGKASDMAGLGFLDVETRFQADKTLSQIEGIAFGGPVSGYEMHMGDTSGTDAARPFMTIDGASSGAISQDGRIMGCYLHGLFADDDFRHRFLEHIKARAGSGLEFKASVESALNAVAGEMESYLDIDALVEVTR